MGAANSLFSCIADDLKEVDALLKKEFTACPVPRVTEVGLHVIGSGGKRMRPAVTLLMARAIGYQGSDHVLAASAIELLHTASLMHDDVIDLGTERRGKPTANALWGNTLAVLIGDFMYTRSFEMLARTKKLEILEPLTHAANMLSMGEVLQLDNIADFHVDEARYFAVIERKTSILFKAAAQMVCAMAAEPPEVETALENYCRALGNAFQITDDIIDYVSDASVSGKKPGADYAEGKVTLPVIYAYARSDKAVREKLQQAFTRHNIPFEDVAAIIRESGAIEACQARAAKEIENGEKALAGLLPSIFKTTLVKLISYVLGRKS